MKITMYQTEEKDHNNPYTRYTFKIIGEREKNSTNIPVWEKTIQIAEAELSMSLDKDLLKKTKTENALQVFLKFFQDKFLKK